MYSALNLVENRSQLKVLKEEDYSFEIGKSVNLKLLPTIQEGKSCTPGDNSIISFVATHWSEEERVSRTSPKHWVGIGIPNSTNKYQEDQKVSQHTTPFEERLEKALSDETSIITLRKDTNPAQAIDFEGIDEHNSALSQLQPSAYSHQMVSF